MSFATRRILGWRRLPIAPALLLVVLAALLRPAAGEAKQPLELGFFDNLFESSDASLRDRWLAQASDDGARYVLQPVIWRDVAPDTSAGLEATNPADPNYDWEAVDRAVRSSAANDLEVILAVTDAPDWAEGEGRAGSAPVGTWRPDPAQFGQFAEAVSRRYSGSFDPGQGGPLPRVGTYQAWTEPNLPEHLTPQWEGRKLRSAGHYRSMLNAFYAAVNDVDPSNRVITAGTAPYGDGPGGSRSRPLRFWRDVMCLDGKLRKERCPSKASFDVLSHHPINTSGAPDRSALNPDDISSADMGVLGRTLAAAERANTIKPVGPHPLWATEIWWSSDPPDRRFGFNPATQARYLARSLYLLWEDRVDVAINLRIRDADPSVPQAGTGLYFLNGQPKPSARAFSFPFVADEREGRKVAYWGKAPQAGKVVIEAKRRGKWKKVSSLTAGKSRIFTGRDVLAGPDTLRARQSGAHSTSWKVR